MSPQMPRRQKSLPTGGLSTNTALKVRTCLRATVASRFGPTLEVSLFPAVNITNRPRHIIILQYFRPDTGLSSAPISFCSWHCMLCALLCPFNHFRNSSTKSSVLHSTIFRHFLQTQWWKRSKRGGRLSVELSSFKTGLWNLTSLTRFSR